MSSSPPQCRAMGKEIPPLALEDESSFDMTAPDMANIEGKRDLIQAFMDAVYGAGANLDGEVPRQWLIMISS